MQSGKEAARARLEQAIVGKWMYTLSDGFSVMVEFQQGGTTLNTRGVAGKFRSRKGYYEAIDSSHIRFRSDDGTDVRIYRVEVAGDQLALIDTNLIQQPNPRKFKRLKTTD